MPPVLKRLFLWTLVCCISAAPSFIIGYDLFGEWQHVAGMLLGIVTWIVAYTWVTGTRPFVRLRRNRYARRTLMTGYATRLLLSIVFPAGLFLDMVCGALSVGLVQQTVLPEKHFVTIYLTTIVQGAVLNVVLVLYMLMIYGLQRLFGGKLPGLGQECVQCRYDLRASTGVCPECGTPIASPAVGIAA